MTPCGMTGKTTDTSFSVVIECEPAAFALGIWLAGTNPASALRKPQYKRLVIVAISVFLLGMVTFVYLSATDMHSSARVTSLMKIFTIPYVPLLIVWIWGRDWTSFKLTPLISYVAAHSYGLYLSHALIFSLFFNLYTRTGIRGYGATYLIGSLASVALVCLLLPSLSRRVMIRRKTGG